MGRKYICIAILLLIVLVDDCETHSKKRGRGRRSSSNSCRREINDLAAFFERKVSRLDAKDMELMAKDAEQDEELDTLRDDLADLKEAVRDCAFRAELMMGTRLGENEVVKVIEVFDRNDYFNQETYQFRAPCDGTYSFGVNLEIVNGNSANAFMTSPTVQPFSDRNGLICNRVIRIQPPFDGDTTAASSCTYQLEEGELVYLKSLRDTGNILVKAAFSSHIIRCDHK